jgi:hypothetical protein
VRKEKKKRERGGGIKEPTFFCSRKSNASSIMEGTGRNLTEIIFSA